MAAAQLKSDPFSARDTFETGDGPAGIYRLSKLEEAGLTKIDSLPFSIRVLLESCLRNFDGEVVTPLDHEDLKCVLDAIDHANVDAIAVCLLNRR